MINQHSRWRCLAKFFFHQVNYGLCGPACKMEYTTQMVT